MIDINTILLSFTPEKQQKFILFLEKKNKRKIAKDVLLSNHIINQQLNWNEICTKIYGNSNKSAFYALKKRLFESIIEFIANSNLKEENSIEHQLLKQIIAARYFLDKGNYLIGYKILDKAEQTSKEYQLFSILNEIYYSKIQYTHLCNAVNLDINIQKFNQNRQNLNTEETINIIYAKIRKLLIQVSHQQKNIDINSVVKKVFKDHNINFSDNLSFKSLYQLIQITHISSLQNFNFWNIENLLLQSYQIIKNHKSKERQLYYHLEVLYVISNTLFRNKKFSNSLQFLELMNENMQKQNRKYYKEYLLKYTLLLALNYNYLTYQEKAIDLLQSVVNQLKSNKIALLRIYLLLIVLYFQKSEFKKAAQLFSNFYHTDKWYIEKVGIIWTIKKNLIEILLLIDMESFERADSRILSFKRNYFNYLKTNNYNEVITYFKLVEMYYNKPEIITTKNFIKKVEGSFAWLGKEKEDIFMISFFAWLKSKMTKNNLYEVTLELTKN